MNKNPYTSMKFDNTPYEKAKVDTEAKINNIYDAEIGNVSNQQILAGSVQGVGNIGRLSADVASRVYGQRDQRIANNFAEISQQKMASEAAFNREKQNLSNEWEANKPNAWDYITSAASFLPGVGQFASAIGVFDKMFSKKGAKTATPAFNYNGIVPPNFDITTNQTDNTTITPSVVDTGVNDVKQTNVNYFPSIGQFKNYTPSNILKPFQFQLDKYGIKKRGKLVIG